MTAALRLRAPMVRRFVAFVSERERVRLARAAGRPAPWTRDPILQQYKFTNVQREHDRVTIWVDQHIRKPYAQHDHLWFMLALARQINWPDTLQELMDVGAWPGGELHTRDWYDPKVLRRAMLARQARGEKLYTGAYMINAQYGKETEIASDKAYFTAHLTMGVLWKARRDVLEGGALSTSLRLAHQWLLQFRGWGDFLTAQVIADLKHTRYLQHAPDWHDWAVLGPGSTRGLNRVLGAKTRKERKYRLPEDVALGLLKALRQEVSLLHTLCLQDVQNCLCEFDKYERARLGEGRPRATYPGTGDEG